VEPSPGSTEQRRPAPPADELACVVVGVTLWSVALVLGVFFRDDLDRHDASWWLWSCVIGILLGLYGLRVALRRRRS
jgi:Protein of unknown function (DUF2530)